MGGLGLRVGGGLGCMVCIAFRAFRVEGVVGRMSYVEFGL